MEGIEVHVRNVPQQGTENRLTKFLRPHLSKLSIYSFHCQKSPGRTHASLTFLHATEGERFLAHHGQVRNAPKQRPTRTSSTAVNLMFLDRPIYCEKSNRAANPYTIRMLQKEEKDRQTKVKTTALERVEHPKNEDIFPVSFECRAVACGVWTYPSSTSELVFVEQLRWDIDGIAKFGERDMILRLNSGLRIDFGYSAILAIVTEAGITPSLILSMSEAPRFFESIVTDPVADLMAQLAIQGGSRNQPNKSRTDRHRIPYINEQHKPIAGNCLVWRIALEYTSINHRLADDVGERMDLLRTAHGVPPMIYRHTDSIRWRESLSESFRRLSQKLSSLALDLPFKLIFQIQKLAQNNYLSPTTVINMLPEIQEMVTRSEVSVVTNAVRRLCNQIDWPGPDVEGADFHIDALLGLLRDNEASLKREGMSIDEAGTYAKSDNVAIIHRAKVTPAGIKLYGPEPETNNRVLRKYPNHHEYFLRVQFCDEDGQPVRFNQKVSHDKIFNGRFKGVLEEGGGINIGGRQYEFLGFSHSSLRAQSCWFMAAFIYDGSLLYDRMVIRDLGDFTAIQSPAKCAARIGQVFSDTPTSVAIHPSIVRRSKDVEFNGRVFSDGVGTMSWSVMYKIWDRLSNTGRLKPTCFQIRYSGAKGMLSYDPRLQGEQIVIRDSMVKFEGTNTTDLEICEGAWKPLILYLNRQLIKIMEDMGVEDRFFLDLQAKEVERLRMITDSPINASTFLKRQSIGEVMHLPYLINRLAALGLDFRRDGFLRDVLEMALLVELRLLKHKTRIPVEKGWHLHGIMDETGTLEEGQIFCIVNNGGTSKVISGKNIIVSRAPGLHPGDVQLAEGVMLPHNHPLRDLHNCVVFSQKGARDLPSKLSGGDLDGDRYYVIWDEAAYPKRYFGPADYPRQTPVDIGRPVERQDMTDFFIKFMETDQLGRIAVLHRVLADQRDKGTLDPDCITLAEMHSTAVDFSKTGIPVDMTRLPKYSPYRPDFEAPGPHVNIEKKEGICFDNPPDRGPDNADDDDDFQKYRYYESDKILGKLYRAIDERKIYADIQARSHISSVTHTSTVISKVWDYVQRKCQLIQWKHHTQFARDIRDQYEDCTQNIMVEYSEHPMRPLTELETFIGNILGRTGAQTKHQRELSVSLKERFDTDAEFIVKCIINEDGSHSEEALERSMACLAVSLEERTMSRKKEQILSFKYVAAAVCLREVERTFPGL